MSFVPTRISQLPELTSTSTGDEALPVTDGITTSKIKIKNLYQGGTLTANTVDINGGAIDGTVVGGSVRAAGSFTTLSATGNVGVGTTSAATQLEVSNGTFRGQLTVHRNNGSATTTMGSIALAGNNGSGTKTTFAQIEAFSGSVGAGAENGNLLFSTIRSGALTEGMRIDSSGQVGIGLTPTARNNTRLQIVDGIGFPATQVASSDANTLDDYEEGTFTPTLTFQSAGDLVVAYSQQAGRYTKVGNKVNFIIRILTSTFTHTTATGQFRISGLPFTTGASGNRPAIATLAGGWTAAGRTVGAYVEPGTVYMVMGAHGTGVTVIDTAPANWPTTATVNLFLSGYYEV